MRWLRLAALGVALPMAAWAQTPPAPAAVLPLLPPTQASPPSGIQSEPLAPPPGVASPSLVAPQPAAPGAPAETVPQPQAPNPWLPQGSAVLQVLDKPDAQRATLTVKVGQSATYRSLTIAVQACVIRPPDMPPDAAAFLAIADQHPDQPGFHGWMLESDPSLNMLQNPIYDVRVIGCVP